jgi:hypothetical protein
MCVFQWEDIFSKLVVKNKWNIESFVEVYIVWSCVFLLQLKNGRKEIAKSNVLCWQICGVHVGQLVWARHKNRRYYKGRVANISEIQFYMVLFSDGSFSDDLYPEDITVSLCLK